MCSGSPDSNHNGFLTNLFFFFNHYTADTSVSV